MKGRPRLINPAVSARIQKTGSDLSRGSVSHGKMPRASFRNEFWNHFQPGIYVDITTGEPSFLPGQICLRLRLASFSRPAILRFCGKSRIPPSACTVPGEAGLVMPTGHVFNMAGVGGCVTVSTVPHCVSSTGRNGRAGYGYLLDLFD